MGLLSNCLRPAKKFFFRFTGLHLGCMMFSPRLLDMERVTKKDVLQAVKTARANQPGVPVYILTDISIPLISGTQQIRSADFLKTAPVPSAIVLACNSDELALAALSRFKTPHKVIRNNIITDALPPEVREIALCNIDVDMYEAIAAALAKVAPLMIVGGIIIAEDQGHTPLLVGAYVAVRDFLDSAEGKKFLPIEMMSGQMFLVKIRS